MASRGFAISSSTRSDDVFAALRIPDDVAEAAAEILRSRQHHLAVKLSDGCVITLGEEIRRAIAAAVRELQRREGRTCN